MNASINSIGAVIAVLVLVLAVVLTIIGQLPITITSLIALLAIARLT
jgi:hypothetical protein